MSVAFTTGTPGMPELTDALSPGVDGLRIRHVSIVMQAGTEPAALV
jgi:hypothetical protein